MRQRDPTLTAADLPRVMTIDSSQGDESYMVFFDASIQHGNMMGMNSWSSIPDSVCADYNRLHGQ